MEISGFQAIVNVFLLVLGIYFLKEKSKEGFYYLLLIIWTTPFFWLILSFLKPDVSTKKTRIVSIISFLIGIGSIGAITYNYYFIVK